MDVEDNNVRCQCGHKKGWHEASRGECRVKLNLDGSRRGNALYHVCEKFKLNNLSYLELKYEESLK